MSLELRSPRRARRWTRTLARRLVVVGTLALILLLASASLVSASVRPSPGGYGDLFGGRTWSGWHHLPPLPWSIWAAWPRVACEEADEAWHASNVSLECTAAGDGIPLRSPADATFRLSTSVADGAEDAKASTGTRTICNDIGNCATAGPISANRVDLRAPDIVAIVSPIEGPYEVGAVVHAYFGCSDHGSGLLWCPSPTALDTTRPGLHAMTFQAIDVAGNVASVVIDYSVVAGHRSPMIVFPDPGGSLV